MDEMSNSYRLFAFERETRERGFHLIAGIDEAGRGPLAGPVVAAAVILPENCMLEGLNDSKKLTASQRERLFPLIHQTALSIGIGVVAHRIIDEINILEATKKAMLKAVSSLSRMPDFLLIDGTTPLNTPIKQATLVKGDSRCASIASASANLVPVSSSNCNGDSTSI